MSECSIQRLEENNIQKPIKNSSEFWGSSPFSAKAALPYSLENLHPDDAKDKVFAAILKALVIMDNKPSSPKELANCIMKHKFTILGGATPYATVSSRISQHFKRAAEHKPPRPPLLARIVDEIHSRKIHYYIADDVTSKENTSSFTDMSLPKQAPNSLKESTAVEGGYPKLKIRLKKRKKNSMRGAYMFKKYKTVLSGPRPGTGKGKWVPRTEHHSCNSAYSTDSSGSGSDADIDEIGPDSEQEFNNEAVSSLSTLENSIPSFDRGYASHDSILNAITYLSLNSVGIEEIESLY
ncbi:hypothetical protein K7432_016464 [Basidiobolus ranarum]|uniref:GDS1 winged helix domain-containing protein n=1 Tax=Basidiobolus ranarum TaxID=34480 RepID=A0ABR2VLK3_9FUNG